ncbi:MAG: BMP family ABC transporter substrate-binding protein [Treponema sp.]|nr:BMP family ABC transporter substrate-binding protein [Treponema sp.]
MKKIFVFVLAFSVLVLSGCSKKTEKKSVAVFIPGIMDGSPIYELLAQGVQNSVNKYNSGKSEEEQAELFIMEAGPSQSEWGPKITSLCASGKYDVIISSNPSIPELVEPITKQFPIQKFILLDGYLLGNENVYTVSYDQSDAAYLAGYIAALMSESHKIGLIAAQEYPVMNDVLHPNFVKGAEEAFSGTSCDFRIVGNWYDANKGMEISDNLIKNGVDVILPICGGASQGVIASAVNNGTYICWFDSNGFSKAPGTVISSSVILQDKMAEQVTDLFFANNVPWGNADSVGIKEGFVKFIEDDPLYISSVPEEVRVKMRRVIEGR